MTIKRFPYEGLGRCEAVVSDGIVCAVATDPSLADGIIAQTQNTRNELRRILEAADSGLAGMLQATVYLNDVRQKPDLDSVWLDWIGPVRSGCSVKADENEKCAV